MAESLEWVSKNISLPTPTVEQVKAECDAFDQEDQLIEKALGLLRDRFPENKDTSHVLLKVLVLNKLYNAGVNDIDVRPLAIHIAGLGIDPLLNQGVIAVVDRITTCPGLKKKHLCFASKFCSWHNPTVYPIWDSNARACLWAYKKRDQFANFHNYDLWVYEKFLSIINAFRNRYELNCFTLDGQNRTLTLRDLDKFLFRWGGRILHGTA
jgi:hypothetical protein